MTDSRSVNLVLVHGAWHAASSWDQLLSVWNDSTVSLSSFDLPSVDGTGNLSRDAAALIAHCQRLEEPTVLLGHSYGGAVVTQAAAHISNLIGLIYLAAMKPSLGESVAQQNRLSPVESELNRSLNVLDGQLVLNIETAAPLLYEDPSNALRAWISTSTHPQSSATFTEPVSSLLPDGLATIYLLCTRDRTIPPPLQQLIASTCDKTSELASGHCPNIDQPELLRDCLNIEIHGLIAES